MAAVSCKQMSLVVRQEGESIKKKFKSKSETWTVPKSTNLDSGIVKQPNQADLRGVL